MYGLGRPSETIHNLILMHKLIRIHSVFLLTICMGSCLIDWTIAVPKQGSR